MTGEAQPLTYICFEGFGIHEIEADNDDGTAQPGGDASPSRYLVNMGIRVCLPGTTPMHVHATLRLGAGVPPSGGGEGRAAGRDEAACVWVEGGDEWMSGQDLRMLVAEQGGSSGWLVDTVETMAVAAVTALHRHGHPKPPRGPVPV